MVFGLRPVRPELSATEVVPDPIDCEVVAVYVDNVLLVPHSNQAVVDAPLGLTLPVNVDALEVTEVAAVVVTVGRVAGVVKLKIPSFCVPAPFCAATRK